MGVTSGFLRVSPEELELLRADTVRFSERLQNWHSPDYLDMDRAGIELAALLNPGFGVPPAPYPHLLKVLLGGEPFHPDLELGCGAVRLIAQSDLENSLSEFAAIQLADLFALAENELIQDLTPEFSDLQEFERYHWAYFLSLRQFAQTVVTEGQRLLRY